jgi:hypothetical protein
MLVWPPSTEVAAGAPPPKATLVMRIFAASAKSSPAMRPPPSALDTAQVSSSGRARASATSSFRERTGSDGFTQMISGL